MSATVPVEPARILKQLGKLWGDLGRDEQDGVLRACAMTFIVAAGPDSDAQALGETIAGLMHGHPSRAIVIRMQPGASLPLEARVLAQCWMPFGKRQQICCEQIEIVTTADMLGEAAAVVRGLTVPDLPVVLYCRDTEVLFTPEFAQLLPLAGKLIVDSGRAEDSVAMLRFLTTVPRRLRVADLAWTRLTPWREVIAQIFENPDARRSVYEIDDVRILYARAEEPVAAYYMAGWFMSVLGASPHIFIARGVGPAWGGIARVSMHHEDDFEAWVELMDDTSIETRVNGVEQRLVFPRDEECRALSEELGIAGRDTRYEEVLGLAALLRGVA